MEKAAKFDNIAEKENDEKSIDDVKLIYKESWKFKNMVPDRRTTLVGKLLSRLKISSRGTRSRLRWK